MNIQSLAPHETMEVHEILNFKTVGLAKSKLMQGIVFDKDLKALMQKDVEQSIRAINALQSLYTRIPVDKMEVNVQ
jgi:similar to spore coat protein